MRFNELVVLSLVAAAIAGSPAIAQMQTGSGSMQSNTMDNSSMMPKMSKSQMKQMDKCKAMSSDMMAKNKTCAKMMKMHPEMMNSTGM